MEALERWRIACEALTAWEAAHPEDAEDDSPVVIDEDAMAAVG